MNDFEADSVFRCEAKIKISHNGKFREVEYLAFRKKTSRGLIFETLGSPRELVTLTEEFVKENMEIVE